MVANEESQPGVPRKLEMDAFDSLSVRLRKKLNYHTRKFMAYDAARLIRRGYSEDEVIKKIDRLTPKPEL